MGGMQVLEWAALLSRTACSPPLPIAAAARHTAQNIAFHEVGRQAIMADPDWRGGDYWRDGKRPHRGLAVARMAAHITYLSESGAAPEVRPPAAGPRATIAYGFDADFQVESYLRHQGISFVDRFDANSYLYITRAMDYFDLAERARRRAGRCLPRHHGALLRPVASPATGCIRRRRAARIVHALNAVAANVSFVEIETDNGPRRLPARRAGVPPRARAASSPARRSIAGWRSRTRA